MTLNSEQVIQVKEPVILVFLNRCIIIIHVHYRLFSVILKRNMSDPQAMEMDLIMGIIWD